MYYGRSFARNENDAGCCMETAQKLSFRCTTVNCKLFNDLYGFEHCQHCLRPLMRWGWYKDSQASLFYTVATHQYVKGFLTHTVCMYIYLVHFGKRTHTYISIPKLLFVHIYV